MLRRAREEESAAHSAEIQEATARAESAEALLAEVRANLDEVRAEVVTLSQAPPTDATLDGSAGDPGVDAELVQLRRTTRLLVAVLVAVLAGGVIGLVPWLTHWKWLEHHPHRVGLYTGAIGTAAATCWAIVDVKHRAHVCWGLLVALGATVVQVV